MQFGGSDAFFGLGEADAPVQQQGGDDEDGFDLDRDDVSAAPAAGGSGFDMNGLDQALPGGGMGGGMGGMPPGGMVSDEVALGKKSHQT